jgi:anti-sigma B factor antagonist
MGFAPFTARVLPGTSATTIALSGELDVSTIPILEEHLVSVEADGVTAIVVDLVELTFIESLGVRALVAARERAFANGRQLVLFGAKANVRRVFELTGTDFLLEGEDARLFMS